MAFGWAGALLASPIRVQLSRAPARWQVTSPPPVILRGTRFARAGATVLSHAARLGTRHFANGIDRDACRMLHDAARLRALYRFAPPPPFRLLRQRPGVDEYGFRSPFASPWRARNDAGVLLHHRPDPRPLVVLNVIGGAIVRRLLGRALVPLLTEAGVDVALPLAPGAGRRRAPDDRRYGWAHSVGAALAAIVQLVHDNVAVESWARERGYGTVVVTGIGVGGTVAALLAATSSRFDAYVPVLAGAHPGRLWMPPRPLARAVHDGALARDGVRSRRALARLFDPVAPNRMPAPRVRHRCTVVGLRFDTVVPRTDVRDLADHWSLEPRWIARGSAELGHWSRELAAMLAQIAHHHPA